MVVVSSGRYVQHIIQQKSTTLWKLLKTNEVCIYVAGNANNMPESVRDAFVEVYCKEGGLNAEKAKMILEEMEGRGRYQTETWA